jgi:phosphomannomutase
MADPLTLARAWLAADCDPETCAELGAILDAAGRGDAAAAADLAERFGGRLAFGTAGLRGVIGAGPMRMNRLVVRQTTAGLADYLIAKTPGAAERGVVIGHDARRGSRAFAEDAACVLAARGLRVHLAFAPWPTPVTAWAVGALGAAAGVMVTASHNPPEYNGYKVYWGNGAQIIPPHDTGIAAAIDRVAASSEAIAIVELADARASGRVKELGPSLVDAYLERASQLLVARDAPRKGLVIAYTPLHGVGAECVERALAAGGFDRVHTEASQREPDPAFPTVPFPNPEEKGAMDRVLALATRVSADLVLANDPDADRLAVAIPAGGAYQQLTGDEVGALFADYLLGHQPPGKYLVATTIVSSQLLRYLADAYGADYRETLTGFKWIGNAALDWEREHRGGRFVMGYEEALGYSVGDLVRDKDGVTAALVFAELAAWNRAQGRSIAEHLADVYRRVGLFVTAQVSMTAPGATGLARIAELMARFRSSPPAAIGGQRVIEAIDLAGGAGGLPKSDVLIYRLDGGRRVIMRPSGTEPKLKSYYEVRVAIGAGEPMTGARARGAAELAALRDAHQAMLG